MKRAFVSWTRETKLSEFLAHSLRAEMIISYKKKTRNGTDIPVIFRYIWQGIDTYKKLRDIRPDVILVQNPPIFAVLTVYLYCQMNKAYFIMDTHTAGFLDKKWSFFKSLHNFLAEKAILASVHNYKNLELQKKWGARNGYVLQFYNPHKEEIFDDKTGLDDRILRRLNAHSDSLKVFMVNRFAGDDAWKEVVAAARIMPWAQFILTGDDSKLCDHIKMTFPSNVLLTGYLPHEKFISLMNRSDVVLALTKRKDTVLWSIREIMALGKPFIISDTAVLRHYFSDVAMFTDHKSEDLKMKIEKAYSKRFEIRGDIEKFVAKDRIRWQKDIENIEYMIKNRGKIN